MTTRPYTYLDAAKDRYIYALDAAGRHGATCRLHMACAIAADSAAENRPGPPLRPFTFRARPETPWPCLSSTAGKD